MVQSEWPCGGENTLGFCHVCVQVKLIYSLPYLFAAALLDRDIDLTFLTSGTYKCGLWI